jgi:hypothetical protein
MGISSEVIRKQIFQKLPHIDDKYKEKNSFYFWIGTIEVRISDHKTYLQTWVDRLKHNPQLRPTDRISIVFEDKPTVGSNKLNQFRMKPLVVHEICYELWNGANINGKMIKEIVQAIFSIKGSRTFVDPTQMACDPYDVIYEPSEPPSASTNKIKNKRFTSENKQYNTMNKIRLTESTITSE